ncbi:MAG TPA: glycosyltransferase [Candidatus Limnocylindria bacterium]|jgi:dolichyl-phosphate beta-glucosyltransferase|nr:glycosyltransferase [Candidatus Limnocylindria bacterium]
MPTQLSIVIPAYNERERLGPSLELLAAHLARFAHRDSEVIVVDDGSTDGTPELVREWSARWPALRLVQLPVNQGKGAAVRAGVRETRGDVIAFADADLSAPIEQLELLLADLDDAEIAILSRALPGTRLERRQSRPRETMGKLYALLAQVLVIAGVPDAQCGLKAYRGPIGRELFGQARESGVLFDTEVLALAAKRRLRISQRPALWRHDPASRLHFGVSGSIGIAVALLRLKVRHRIFLAVRAAGPIRSSVRSPAYPQGVPAGGTKA